MSRRYYKNAALYKSETGRNNATYGLRNFKDFTTVTESADKIFSSKNIEFTDTDGNAVDFTGENARGNNITYTPEEYATAKDTNVNTVESYKFSAENIIMANKFDDTLKNSLQKYFGTNDAFSIWVAATEQEYGSGKQKKITGAARPKPDNDKK